MQVDLAQVAGMAGTAFVAAAIGVLMAGLVRSRRGRPPRGIFTESQAGTVFLFDGETLLDATPGARALLAASSGGGAGPWSRLLAYLVPRFPDFARRIGDLPSEGRLTLVSGGDGPTLALHAELTGGITRIQIEDQTHASRGRIDPLAQRALTDEVEQLRAVVARAPLMMWREDSAGEVVWANGAYLHEVARRLEPGEDLSWPLPRLFQRSASVQGATGQRQRLEDEVPRWFDLVSFGDGVGRLVFALPADAAVQAEASLRDFMQTLAKTFAHLPIGLAIFDQHRKLALFNPALLDLTRLPPDMLALKPTLFSFLDALRERQMIPEQKDYPSWRRTMLALEKAASSSLYQETWSLPGGQTYRVIGRPHPNGAVALMFEDISTEMTRNRRYRADLELGQSVIDSMSEAIAVFSAAGQLVMTNSAYAGLWGHDPVETVGADGIGQLCAHWSGLTAPSPIWAEAERFVSLLGERKPWTGEARLNDGRLIACRFAPLTGGATLASFRVVRPDEGGTLMVDAALRRA